MFAPRVLAVLLVGLAACLAMPADSTTNPAVPKPVTTITDDDIVEDSSWFTFPLFGNLFAPLWRFFPSFAEIGPKIIADDNKFQVVVNVKDYKQEDLKVKVKSGFIFVQGTHEGKQDERDVFSSQFFHTYSLPANCSGSDVTADLSSDGYLTVTAPLNGPSDSTKAADREVPIQETGTPYKPPKEEKPVKSDKPISPEPTPASVSEFDNDRKEPTTPHEREEITEKDNSIPHGNEVVAL